MDEILINNPSFGSPNQLCNSIPSSLEEITVVIPAHNAEQTIAAQLRALSSQVNAPRFSIVVVNNDSTDATVQVVESVDMGEVPLRVVNEPRLGINLARNTGIESCPEGIVLLCDADDVVSESWVAALSEVITEGKWAAGPTLWIKAALDEALVREDAHLVSYPHWLGKYPDRTIGCNCGFSTSMWRQLGGFDNRLSGQGDETEFFNRARLSGMISTVVEEAAVLYRVRPPASVRSEIRLGFHAGFHHHLVSFCEGGIWVRAEANPRGATILFLRALMSLLKYAWSSQGRRHWIKSMSYRTARLLSPALLTPVVSRILMRKSLVLGPQILRWTIQ